jgi:hypothetical protein
MRTPVFELHILPMIRATDREHMRFAFDMWDYGQLVQHAEAFADRAAVDMPPVDSGGPWPEEWVRLFRQWMATGFKRLTLGTAQYTWSQSATTTTIRATGTYPAAGYKGWLQLETETESSKTYILYFEAPDVPAGGTPADFSLRERYGPTDHRSVFIRDSAGVQRIN